MKGTIVALCFLIASIAAAVEIEPVVVIGTAVADRREAWDAHVNFVEWLDDDTVVYAGEAGFVKCYDVRGKAERWAKTIDGKLRRMAAGGGRVFMFDKDGAVQVLDGASGGRVKLLDSNTLAAIVGADHVIPNNLAWVPKRNVLVVATYSDGYGDNCLLLDGETFKSLGRAKSEGFVRDVRPTRDGSHIVTYSGTSSVRIWSLEQAREALGLGDGRGAAIDAPFISNAAFDGDRTLVYAIDNSWATGNVHVYDTREKKEVARFDSRNGHAEMDVDFASARVALTGTSKGLALVGSDGRVLAERLDAADQRIVAVKFSPEGKRLAIASWDTTMRVFAIKDDRPDKAGDQEKK